jgi:hypothetical protein
MSRSGIGITARDPVDRFQLGQHDPSGLTPVVGPAGGSFRTGTGQEATAAVPPGSGFDQQNERAVDMSSDVIPASGILR